MPLFGGGKSELQKAYNYDTKKDKLGEGNFAEVFKATLSKPRTAEKLGEPIPDTVAIKVIDKAKVEDMNDITREIEIMQAVGHHPNIICLFEVFDEKKTVNLVMELVTGGELFDMIVHRGNYTEKDAANTIVTLCDALGFLHSKNVVHRDLKPENILIESPNSDKIKIADFGLARTCGGGEVMKTACGTPGYVAPEILKNKGYDSPAVDMWSVGVILYILLCGFPPFYEEELPVRKEQQQHCSCSQYTSAHALTHSPTSPPSFLPTHTQALFETILHAKYDFPSPWWDPISPGAKELIQKFLTVDPTKRMTAEGAKSDGWICSASDSPLAATQKQLKKYNANRRLRKAAMGIIMQKRVEKALAELRIKVADK